MLIKSVGTKSIRHTFIKLTKPYIAKGMNVF